MGSWILAVLIVSFGLPFARLQKGRRLLGLVKASTVTGTLCYLLGWSQVFFAFPSHACPDLDHTRPAVHFDRYESSVFPLQATCYRDDGERKELVSGWVDPLLFTCVALWTGCLVTLTVLAHRRYRKQTGRATPLTCSRTSAPLPPAGQSAGCHRPARRPSGAGNTCR